MLALDLLGERDDDFLEQIKTFNPQDQLDLLLHLAKAGSEIVADRLLGVQPEMLRVSTNEAFIEDSAGKIVEVLLFNSAEHTGADLGDVGNVVKRELSHLARLTKFVPEISHHCPASECLLARCTGT